MSAARIGITLAAALAAPTLVATPHLASSPETAVPRQHEARKFSQLAVAGMRLYVSHCEDCHGRNGVGTEKGPSLHYEIYHAPNLGQVAFHTAVKHGVQESRWEYGDMPKSNLSFNEIEQVARYVRDVQRGITFR